MIKRRPWALLFLLPLLAACDLGTALVSTPTAVPAPPTLPPTATTIAVATMPPIASTGPLPSPLADSYDAGGHKLFLLCEGAGSPTVVLDAGLGNPGEVWTAVQDGAAPLTRICRYDRAGLGFSAKGPMPRTSAVLVEELRTLLKNAGIPGPYVLAGASFGGMNMRLYAGKYPQEVLGLVLVDALHPDLDTRIEKLMTPEAAAQRRADLGVNDEGITFDDILASDEQVRAAPPLPNIPLVVLRHGVPFDMGDAKTTAAVEALWQELQADYAKGTPQGKLVVAERSGHRIHQVQPDLVIAAIRDVVEATRKR